MPICCKIIDNDNGKYYIKNNHSLIYKERNMKKSLIKVAVALAVVGVAYTVFKHVKAQLSAPLINPPDKDKAILG